MGHSTGSTGDRRTARWLTLVTAAAVTSLGCEAGKTTAPVTAIDPIGTKPSNSITSSDGSALPCFANSRACGEFLTSIGGPVNNTYVIIGPNHMGAWTRTWSPTNEAGYMSAVGSGVTRKGTGRNERQVPFNISDSNYGTQVGDGYVTPQTCASERNEILGSSRNSAQGPNLMAWFGTFSHSSMCEGPPPQPGEELSCDENGTPVDEGGDPANCPGDDSGGGGNEGSGTQYHTGDYTNGETVDWATGIGNGGSSVCGSAAQVDYICIDTWNAETQSWQEWGCGYATTC
ncbi:MAG TPA: hypothetical protein VIP11_26405 [Gemmatimonadaceae bacterium]